MLLAGLDCGGVAVSALVGILVGPLVSVSSVGGAVGRAVSSVGALVEGTGVGEATQLTPPRAQSVVSSGQPYSLLATYTS